jgi:hypothetical protein
MNQHRSVKTRVLGWLVLAALTACGQSLIQDPSFELWCGERLCAPWETQGRVERVGTWHKKDHGVALMDGAVISQLSEASQVECIEFALIADVQADAEVWLELDFLDDGNSEYRQPVAESHWAELRFLVRAPTWYDKVRFIIRKEGHGRAVLAQIVAKSAWGCEGEPVPVRNRPAGVICESAADCASGVCEAGPFPFAEILSPQPRMLCSSCGDGQVRGCPQGEVCGVQVTEDSAQYACVTSGSVELGAWCASDEDCATGRCALAAPLAHATCSECASDGDCGEGEVCGTRLLGDGAARVCSVPEPGMRGLGELCIAGVECGSGVCCGGLCSECCDDQAPCPGGATCGASGLDSRIAVPWLCDPRKADRDSGQACTRDEDCRSGLCANASYECLLHDDANLSKCGVVRGIAGVCSR